MTMKTMLIATISAAMLATSAAAGDFDDVRATVRADWNQFFIELEGTEVGGYASTTVGAEVLSYDIGETVTSTLDVYAKTMRDKSDDEYALGTEYTVTYAPNAFSVYGAAKVEYNLDTDIATATPKVGAAYDISTATTAWGEVGYAFDATNDWDKRGGVAEVGVDFKVAENITLTPSIVHNFDRPDEENESQLNLAVGFKF